MKRIVSRVLLATAALAMFATASNAAGGFNLSWTDCGTFGTASKTFACTSNSGANILVASAISGMQMDQLNGMASVMDLQTNQPALSAWWGLQTGGCRAVALSAGFDFTASVNCIDPWNNQAVGGFNFTNGQDNIPNRGRIKTVCAVNPSTSITGTDEYYFVKVTILNSKSVGNGSCAGCTDGACISLNELQLTQPAGVGDDKITTTITRSFVTWQAGGAGIAGGCPGARSRSCG